MASIYGFRTTTDEKVVFQRLVEFHGVNEHVARERLHRIKIKHGMRGDDDVIFDLTGNVYVDDGTGAELVKLGMLTSRPEVSRGQIMEPDPRLRPSASHDHGYAIIRCDCNLSETVPPELRITVKKIVFDAEFAESEVRRLNELNRDKGCHYFSQITGVQRNVSPDVESPAVEVLQSAH